MKASRRNFMKWTAGLPLLGLVAAAYGNENRLRDDIEETKWIMKDHRSEFNMNGYAAPAIPNLRVGYIGLGSRGLASLKRLSQMEGVEIRAIADCYEYPIELARQHFQSINYRKPAEYFESEETWKNLVERDDLDLIYVTTPQYWHAEMACAAMKAGKHVATEVPLAYTLEDCWQIVKTSEQTKKHCALLENCLYDFFEAMTINMALQNLFGEIVYGEGAYLHYFPVTEVFAEPMPPLSKKAGMFRHAVGCTVKGNRYPTHGFGPVCAAMKINAGDSPDFLTSVETDDFVRGKTFADFLQKGSPYHQQFANKEFTGNMNVSLVRTKKGKIIQVQYDTTSMRPYSRTHILSGLKGFVQKYPLPARIYFDENAPVSEERMNELKSQYTPELVRFLAENAIKFGGHGGMDFICDYRLVDLIRNGLPLDITVYEGATWSAVTPLSLWSVTHGSQPIPFPDFTGGNWVTNSPVDLSLRGGGSTIIRS
ncbi:MAG: Gfo/Idh/MocA family oxidoreductase [Planctomycetia bacterium]|nr:Gfo/Idh/MocA family oxidoreductase [Planctomycetia bacterium]